MREMPAQPLLLPRPRGLTLAGGRVELPSGPLAVGGLGEEGAALARLAGLDAVVGSSLQESVRIVRGEAGGSGPEAYELTVRNARAGEPAVVVVACGREGVLNAFRTLSQLLRQYGRGLPALSIVDAPAFPVRGVMLDVSRDRVPTMEHLLTTAERLASLKINHFQLYTEHTFAYAGHEEAWGGWSPMTPAEIRELDTFCRIRGVTLAANQNCFGHLASWLRHPRYAHLAETHGDWTFMDWPRSGPFSLCPTDPASVEFVDGLLGQLLPCFTSGLVNIGCDETFDVGQGRSRVAVAQRGRAAVYFEFVGQVCERVRARGFRPMFWADIALSHPGSIGQIPEDLIALAWGYEPDSPFADWCASLREAGRETWVCPGTSSWRSITGRTSERRANLLAAAAQGKAQGATGYLVTDWGDGGHHQQWPVSLHALAEAADAAWTGGERGGFDPAASSLHAFADGSLAIGSWLDELGDVDVALRRDGGAPAADGTPRPLRNASALFNDLHGHPSGDPRIDDPAAWRGVLGRLDGLAMSIPSGPSDLERAELVHTLAVARLAAEHAALKREPGGVAGPERRRLAAALDGLIEEHRRLWAARSRPGGLGHSCSFYAKARGRIVGSGGG